MAALSLSLQTGTLYASNDASTFTGTGGPWGFSPFTAQFGGTVSSAGLNGEPFNDTVYNVSAGDEVIFVVAVQNLSAGQAAFDLGIRANMPAGFAVPAEGTNLTVTDGTGTDLAFSGDLFGSGLVLSSPVAAFNADSGLNVVLVTYALAATAALPGPYASITSTAAVSHAAATSGGPDGGVAPSASTVVVSSAPTPLVTAETSPAAVARGQTIAFDVSVSVPAGTMTDLRLDEVLPTGSTSLRLLSTTVTGVGSGLSLGTPAVGQDGSVRFGTVSSTGDPAHNTISLRVVVQADGTASGTATLQTVLSSANAGSAGRWSAIVGSSVGVIVPPLPPGIAGLWPAQAATPGTAVHPFGGLLLSDNAPASAATLAITVKDGSLGRLSGGDPACFDTAGATFVMSGSLASLQAAARALVFTPAGTGTEGFTITLIDPSGGVAQDNSTTLAVSGASSDPVTVACGATLAVASMHGTYVMLGQGTTLSADRLSAAAAISGFGSSDQLVLPGSGASVSYTPTGPAGGTLSVAGGASVTLLGVYDPSWFRAAPGPTGTSTVVTLAADPVFDPAYYLAHNPDIAAAGVEPFQHYLAYGWKEGRNPSAWFNGGFYLSRNPDVLAAGLNPLLHYEQFGWKEGRDPSPLFSTRDYLAAYPDVAAAQLNPLVHFVQYGQAEGRASYAVSPFAPDPLVDAATYYRLNPDVRNAGATALTHYLTSGWTEGRNPDGWFDTSFYLTQNPDVRAAGMDPLLHFETYGWKEGRQPGLLFDDAQYLSANPDVAASGANPLLQFVQSGQAAGRASFLLGGTAPADPLVDAPFYDRQLGATLLPANAGQAAQQAAWHFDQVGWKAGLNPDSWFNTGYYLLHNPDVAAAGIDPLVHFESWGWKEGRNPSALFNVRQYLSANPDVAAANLDPLLHYVQNGQAEGRAIFPA